MTSSEEVTWIKSLKLKDLHIYTKHQKNCCIHKKGTKIMPCFLESPERHRYWSALSNDYLERTELTFSPFRCHIYGTK